MHQPENRDVRAARRWAAGAFPVPDPEPQWISLADAATALGWPVEAVAEGAHLGLLEGRRCPYSGQTQVQLAALHGAGVKRLLARHRAPESLPNKRG